jgi:basic membrane lipoprotein Med (substrate-binding protein (PBP1-ABC) superfamily)
VLTSRVKRVDNALLDVIEAVAQRHFQGSDVHSYGFSEDGLTLAPFRPEVADVITPNVRARLEQIRNDVASGKIQVNMESLE